MTSNDGRGAATVPAALPVSDRVSAFTGESVTTTLLVSAGMFGGLAAYGTVTRRSLAGLGQFLFIGLMGVVGGSSSRSRSGLVQ